MMWGHVSMRTFKWCGRCWTEMNLSLVILPRNPTKTTPTKRTRDNVGSCWSGQGVLHITTCAVPDHDCCVSVFLLTEKSNLRVGVALPSIMNKGGCAEHTVVLHFSESTTSMNNHLCVYICSNCVHQVDVTTKISVCVGLCCVSSWSWNV